jgi:hypothetical protein
VNELATGERDVSTTVGDGYVRPYREGLADWLLSRKRVDSRTGWVLYFAVALAIAAVYWGVLAAEGTLPSQFGLIHVILPAFAFAGLPALKWFNVLAHRALRTARPLLRADDDGYELLEYRLTTMPASLFVVAWAIGLGSLVVLTIFRPPQTFEILHIMATPLATIIEWVLQFLTWTGVGVVGVEIARKLWVIDDIYRNHLQINILRPGALSAFSRLGAAMVIFTLTAVMLSTIALAQLGTSTTWLFGAGIPTILAAIAFVAPLWGGHRSMAREKSRQLDSLGETIDATITSLRARVEMGEHEAVGPLKESLEALIAARNEYAAVSTWPWQRATLGGVVTALIAPMAIWLVTRWLDGMRLL